MSVPAIAVAGVSKRLGAHQALVDVTFDVGEGETVVMLGPSGCGKTTTLRLIAGLEIPDTGAISLHGEPVAEGARNIVPSHQRGLGVVFQDLALWPHLTVGGHLQFVLDAQGIRRAEQHARIAHALTLVRIEALVNRKPHELSGGEQQRVAIARALVGRPRVLLLDEPLSSLDRELRSTLRGELARLRQELGLTMLYVTHDPEDGSALADRVLEIRAGRLWAG